VRNNDWENDWVFSDPRFNLLYESDEEFLRFLCETVHPIVRPDADEARKLVDIYNKELAPDGWKTGRCQGGFGKTYLCATASRARRRFRRADRLAEGRSAATRSTPAARYGGY
jgi:hypothetical protein